jgi:hypothetical protein
MKLAHRRLANPIRASSQNDDLIFDVSVNGHPRNVANLERKRDPPVS